MRQGCACVVSVYAVSECAVSVWLVCGECVVSVWCSVSDLDPDWIRIQGLKKGQNCQIIIILLFSDFYTILLTFTTFCLLIDFF